MKRWALATTIPLLLTVSACQTPTSFPDGGASRGKHGHNPMASKADCASGTCEFEIKVSDDGDVVQIDTSALDLILVAPSNKTDLTWYIDTHDTNAKFSGKGVEFSSTDGGSEVFNCKPPVLHGNRSEVTCKNKHQNAQGSGFGVYKYKISVTYTDPNGTAFPLTSDPWVVNG